MNERVATFVRGRGPRDWLDRFDKVERALVIASSGSFLLNVTQTLLNFVLTVTLAHALGAEGIGQYAYAFAWASVLGVPAALGLTPLVIRHVAGYRERREWGLLRGLLRRANTAVLLSSGALVVGGIVVALVLDRARPEFLYPVLVGLLLVPIIAVTSIRQAAMQGLGRVVLGRTPETIVTPALFLLLIAVAWSHLGESFSATWAVALQVAASFAALLVGIYFLRRVLPHHVNVEQAQYEMGSWVRSAIPLLLFSLVQAISAQIDIILLGGIDGASSAGIFSVATKLAGLVTFVMLAVGYALSPAIARLHASGDSAQLKRTVHRAAVFVFLAALPVAVGIIAVSGPLLRLFGSEFETGHSALVVLAISQLLFSAMGFAGTVLVMTGRESLLVRGVVVGAVVTIAANVILIPPFGLNGAAVAALVGTTSMNICLVYYTRRAGIASTAFGI